MTLVQFQDIGYMDLTGPNKASKKNQPVGKGPKASGTKCPLCSYIPKEVNSSNNFSGFCPGLFPTGRMGKTHLDLRFPQ